jgi:hypothetical protein
MTPSHPLKFTNPANGYVEQVKAPVLWALLFGPLYFFSKGAWQAGIVLFAVAWIAIALTGYGAIVVWLGAALMAADIVKKGYLRRGWLEWKPTYDSDDDDD